MSVKKKYYIGVDGVMITGIFEAAMLVCFAASWPFNLRKAFRARTNVGTSILFMSIVLVGYICGVINKLINDDISYVLAFYLLDIALVSTGVLIYIRNKKYDSASSKTLE
jgi:hypothetical protein